jgi:hypothetical protein
VELKADLMNQLTSSKTEVEKLLFCSRNARIGVNRIYDAE